MVIVVKTNFVEAATHTVQVISKGLCYENNPFVFVGEKMGLFVFDLYFCLKNPFDDSYFNPIKTIFNKSELK